VREPLCKVEFVVGALPQRFAAPEKLADARFDRPFSDQGE